MYLVKWKENGFISEKALSEKELGEKWVNMRIDIISIRPL